MLPHAQILLEKNITKRYYDSHRIARLILKLGEALAKSVTSRKSKGSSPLYMVIGLFFFPAAQEMQQQTKKYFGFCEDFAGAMFGLTGLLERKLEIWLDLTGLESDWGPWEVSGHFILSHRGAMHGGKMMPVMEKYGEERRNETSCLYYASRVWMAGRSL